MIMLVAQPVGHAVGQLLKLVMVVAGEQGSGGQGTEVVVNTMQFSVVQALVGEPGGGTTVGQGGWTVMVWVEQKLVAGVEQPQPP